MTMGTALSGAVKAIPGALAKAGAGAALGAAATAETGPGALLGAGTGLLGTLAYEAISSIPGFIDDLMNPEQTPEQIQAKIQPVQASLAAQFQKQGISPDGAQKMAQEAMGSAVQSVAQNAPENHPILDSVIGTGLGIAAQKFGGKFLGKGMTKAGQPVGNTAKGGSGGGSAGGSVGAGSIPTTGTANAAAKSMPTTDRPAQPQPTKTVPSNPSQPPTALDSMGQDRATAEDAGGRGTSAAADATGQPFRGQSQSPKGIAPSGPTSQGYEPITGDVPAFPQRPNISQAGQHTQIGSYSPDMNELARQHGIDPNGMTQSMAPLEMGEETRTQPMNINPNMFDTATHNATQELPGLAETRQMAPLPTAAQAADTQIMRPVRPRTVHPAAQPYEGAISAFPRSQNGDEEFMPNLHYVMGGSAP